MRLGVLVLCAAGAWSHPVLAAAPASGALVEPNDNTRAAGVFAGSTLTVALRAAAGPWQPEGPDGPTLTVEAFGEVGAALTVPAPLIRITEGTSVVVSIANELDAALVVHGLCSRGARSCQTVEVPAHDTREVRFTSGPPGTYHYWASTIGAPMPFRELAGALIVDPALRPVAQDRVIVITEWSDLTPAALRGIMTADVPTEAFVGLRPRLTFVMNGRSWPATERFNYAVGDHVRWRVVNLSSQPHPLHLHGFYFDVESLGDGLRDTTFDTGKRPRVVTQLLASGQTMTMAWTPERPGNWLFHCHVMHHVSPHRRLGGSQDASAHTVHQGHHGHDADVPAVATSSETSGMGGMVIGVTIRDSRPPSARPVRERALEPRRLTLAMRSVPQGTGVGPAAGFALLDGGSSQPAASTTPGPPIVLRRNQPVEIALVNELSEATAIHWHGMELDSFYDGVHGWSGLGRQVTPMIAPGERFVVRFTPPRAGTFIYHTHLHDYRQLSSGLYGALVVLDEGDTFNPATDHVVVIGRAGLASEERSLLADPESVVINGRRHARLVLQAGTSHRLRLINITPDDIFSVGLFAAEGPATWIPVAKDGAELAPERSSPVAARQTIAVGETYDFEFQAPASRRSLWLEVRTPGGKWQTQGHVVVR